MNRIYFYGALPFPGELPIGGGEVGNARTVEVLKNLGYEIIQIPKYRVSRSKQIVNRLLHILDIVCNVFKYAWLLLWGRRKNAIVHISGFAAKYLPPFQFLLIIIARILGYKVVYELRGGRIIDNYEEYAQWYKFFVRLTLKYSTYIFSQGYENIEFIKRIVPMKDVFYYPNYVMNEFLPSEFPVKNKEKLSLLYFGRVAEAKNIEIILQTLKILQNMGYNASLCVVGKPSSEEYLEELKRMVENNNILYCDFLPGCNHDKLKDYLRTAHYYVFPSQEMGEGHSNALTEAMAYGLVPIASDWAYNKSVVGNINLIVNSLSAKKIANVIDKIERTNQYVELSKSMYDRVRELYSEKNAIDNLSNYYRSIFCLKMDDK